VVSCTNPGIGPAKAMYNLLSTNWHWWKPPPPYYSFHNQSAHQNLGLKSGIGWAISCFMQLHLTVVCVMKLYSKSVSLKYITESRRQLQRLNTLRRSQQPLLTIPFTVTSAFWLMTSCLTASDWLTTRYELRDFLITIHCNTHYQQRSIKHIKYLRFSSKGNCSAYMR
jgi:hypothetical protein